MAALYYWAWADLHGGEWGRMHAVLSRGLTMAERNAQHYWAFLFRHLLAWLYLQVHRFEEAREICARGVQEARAWRYPFGELLSPILLGTAHLGLEQYGETRACLEGVLTDLQRRRIFQDWILGMLLQHALGRYWLARRQAAEAAQAAERLHALASVPGERTYLALASEIEARAALLDGDLVKAEARIGSALQALGQGPAPLAAWRMYAAAGELCEAQGDRARSKQYFAQSAAVLTRLANSLGDLEPLRLSLLGAPQVLSIQARAG